MWHNLEILIRIFVFGFLKKEMESLEMTMLVEYLMEKMECPEVAPPSHI